jgi:hypothetical protein
MEPKAPSSILGPPMMCLVGTGFACSQQRVLSSYSQQSKSTFLSYSCTCTKHQQDVTWKLAANRHALHHLLDCRICMRMTHGRMGHLQHLRQLVEVLQLRWVELSTVLGPPHRPLHLLLLLKDVATDRGPSARLLPSRPKLHAVHTAEMHAAQELCRTASDTITVGVLVPQFAGNSTGGHSAL